MKHLTTAFLTLWLCFSTQADDVDLYQGQSSGVRQNVMFLMDTSRSMSRWEYFDIGPYNPDTTYPVPINGFDPETYYYSGLVDGDGSSETETQIVHNRFLHKDALKCGSAEAALETVGWSKDKFKRWNPNEDRWEAPTPLLGLSMGTNRTDAIWVCKSEEGGHSGLGRYIETNNLSSNQFRNSPQGFGLYNTSLIRGWWYHTRNMFKGNYLNYQIFERGENETGLTLIHI